MPGIATAPVPAPVAGPSKSAAAYKARTGFAPTSFRTLDRERAFSHPSSEGHKYTAPQELVQPHVDSFNALFEGAPRSDGAIDGSKGLLDMGIKDLLPKVVFDHKGDDGSLGNRLECASSCAVLLAVTRETLRLTPPRTVPQSGSSRCRWGARRVS